MNHNFTKFKFSLSLVFIGYLFLWLYSIHLSQIQRDQNLAPVLPVIPGDSEEYSILAESIISENSFSIDGHPETFRSPGYPFFIAIFKSLFRNYFGVTFLQIILVFIVAFGIERLGRFFLYPVAGQIAAILFLINPTVMTLSITLLSETSFVSLFIFSLLSMFLYFDATWRRTFILAFMPAIAIYFRPMGLFAMPVFIAPILVSQFSFKKKILHSLGLVGIVFIIMLPWMLRNKEISGVMSFSSLKSFNFIHYNVPLFLSSINNSSVILEEKIAEEKTGVKKSDWRDLTYSKSIDSYTKSVILANPLSYIKFHLISSLPFAFSSSFEFAEYIYNTAMHIESVESGPAIWSLMKGDMTLFFKDLFNNKSEVFEKLLFSFIVLLFVYGLWINGKNGIAYVFVFIVIYIMFMSGPVANVRYRVPIEPLVLILSMNGLVSAYYLLKSKIRV